MLRKIAATHLIEDKPLYLSDGQLEIYAAITLQLANRVIIISPTQYGKSLTVAVGVLDDILATGSRWIIMAPNTKKAEIIMGHVIDHVFDNPDYLAQLEIDRTSEHSVTLERLKRDRTKDNLTFKNGGGVMVLTLNADKKKKSLESAMGFGAKKIVLDESSLIDDVLYATVKRMVGGHTGRRSKDDDLDREDDTFILEIGNPFYRNHFHNTFFNNPRYLKIFIDDEQALKEGRFSTDFLEEMKLEALYDILYKCLFPSEAEIDSEGYRRLITEEEFNNAIIQEPMSIRGMLLKLGVDIAGGGDLNTFVIRHPFFAWLEDFNRVKNTLSNVPIIDAIVKKYPTLHYDNVAIDDTGIGHGVCDRFEELGKPIIQLIMGGGSNQPDRFQNMRAELYWALRTWIKKGGKILDNDGFKELLQIRYKITSDKLIIIEPKEDIKKRLGKSPDHADALVSTFCNTPDTVLSVQSNDIRG